MRGKIINFSPKPKPKKALKCKLCKNIVYVGEKYFVIERMPFCKKCVKQEIAEAFDIKTYLSEIYEN